VFYYIYGLTAQNAIIRPLQFSLNDVIMCENCVSGGKPERSRMFSPQKLSFMDYKNEKKN